MMVSKVAVIALVAIVACPILLGYCMNLNEVTKTGYELSGNSINITEQLYNGNTGSQYSYAHGDLNKMNTNMCRLNSGVARQIPYYEEITTQNGSYPVFEEKPTDSSYNGVHNINDYEFYYFESETSFSCDLYKTVGGVDSLVSTQTGIKSIFIFHKNGDSGSYAEITKINALGYYTKTYVNNTWISKIDITGNYPAYSAYRYLPNTSDNDRYANLAAGFHLLNTSTSPSPGKEWQYIDLPDYTKQFTFTMNLDSITDSNYALHICIAPEDIVKSTLPWTYISMELAKTTVNGVAKWTLRNEYDTSAPITELYTDPTLTNNTYQFTIAADSVYDETTSKYYLVIHVNASYVGDWPTLFGIANPFITNKLDYVIRDDPAFIYNSAIDPDDLTYQKIAIHEENNKRTPTMRIDDALFRAFQYKTITDRTFLPSAYKQNPGITISNIKMYGSAITFGGITFGVNNGKIIVNGQSVKLDGITFNTVLNENGTYDNKVGGIKVSETAEDRGMTFSGSWVGNVTVQSMDTYTYTETEWIPGQFGWDGLDHNFLMVGLLTSLGAFIALGIYVRRTKASLWPLLLVCGGAAVLFFIMI